MRRTREALFVKIRQDIRHWATVDGLPSRQKSYLVKEEEAESDMDTKVVYMSLRG